MERNVIKTGFPTIDAVLSGGMKPGTIFGLMAVGRNTGMTMTAEQCPLCEMGHKPTRYHHLALDKDDFPEGGYLEVTAAQVERFGLTSPMTKVKIEKYKRDLADFRRSLK